MFVALFIPIVLRVNVNCIPIGRAVKAIACAVHAEQSTAAGLLGSPCPFRKQIEDAIYYSTFPRTHLKFSKTVLTPFGYLPANYTPYKRYNSRNIYVTVL